MREARDGNEAVAAWHEWRPHLIWMDMRMPGVDGCEAARRIRAGRDGRSAVIIAVTASGSEEQRAAAREAGCDDFLCKPFDEADLVVLLHKHLGVRFTYSEEQAGATPTGGGAEAVPTALASLPASLLVPLHGALAELDTTAVRQALEAIAAYNSEACSALRALTDNLQYGRLLRMIENSYPRTPHDSP